MWAYSIEVWGDFTLFAIALFGHRNEFFSPNLNIDCFEFTHNKILILCLALFT